MKGVTMNKKITALICAAAMLLVSGCSGQNGSGDSPAQPENSADSVSESEIIDSLNNGIIIDEVSGNAADGAWIYVRGADFGYGASAFTAEP